jgi:hypothetical protein
MSKGGVCSSRRPSEAFVSVGCQREVYVVPDGREMCLWFQMIAMVICGVKCLREVYVV